MDTGLKGYVNKKIVSELSYLLLRPPAVNQDISNVHF